MIPEPSPRSPAVARVTIVAEIHEEKLEPSPVFGNPGERFLAVRLADVVAQWFAGSAAIDNGEMDK